MKKYLAILMTGSLVLCSSLFTLTISGIYSSENHVIESSIKVYTDNPQG